MIGCSGDDTSSSAATSLAATSTTTDVPADDPADDQTDGSIADSSMPTTAPMTTEPAEPPEGGGTATGALGDADIQLETEEGTIQIGVAEVPDGVSGTFPIPADLDVQLSSATETDFGFSGVSAMGIAELAAFYEVGLIEAGYEITARQDVEGVLAVYTFERAAESGQVAISSAPGGAGSSVIVTIGDGTSATEASLGD